MTLHARTPRARTSLAGVATRLAGQRSLWEPLVAFDPVSRYYARLAAEPDFEAWLLTWVPGRAPTGTTPAAAPGRSSPLAAR